MGGPEAALGAEGASSQWLGSAARVWAQGEPSRFRRFVETSPDGIYVTCNRAVTFANPSGLALLGFSEERELLGRFDESFLVDPRDREPLRRRVAHAFATGQRPPMREYRLKRNDGSVVAAEMTCVPLVEGPSSEHAELLVFARNVNDRAHLRTQLARADCLAALGTLAAGVAHEVNNPLAVASLGLDGLTRLLAKHLPPGIARDEAERLLAEVKRAHGRMGTIVGDLRAFSRSDETSRSVVDVGACVAAAERMADHEIRHRARFTAHYGGAPMVIGNAGRLEQVFVNVLLNAAQALPEGREGNEIEVNVAEDADGNAVVQVTDNGIGIAPDVVGRIFDPFFTTKAAGVGTGLGLSISHTIVTQLGGEIVVESTPGHGTTVRIVLPAAAAAKDTVEAGMSSQPSPSRQRARLLIIDDEPSLALTLKYLLQDRHDVTTCTSGAEALSMLRNAADYDAILCDLMMPGTTGMDVHAALAKERPGFEDRIVFMTGGAFTPRATSFLATSANPRLEKPFTADDVDVALHAVAERGHTIPH